MINYFKLLIVSLTLIMHPLSKGFADTYICRNSEFTALNYHGNNNSFERQSDFPSKENYNYKILDYKYAELTVTPINDNIPVKNKYKKVKFTVDKLSDELIVLTNLDRPLIRTYIFPHLSIALAHGSEVIKNSNHNCKDEKEPRCFSIYTAISYLKCKSD